MFIGGTLEFNLHVIMDLRMCKREKFVKLNKFEEYTHFSQI